MSSTRKTALIAGALFLITFLTSIPAAPLFYSPVLDHTNYILGAGADTRMALGALLEILLIIANVGTAVVLFPVLKRQNEGLALGYVAARIIESAFIAIGIVSLQAIVTLRRDVGGAGRRGHARPGRQVAGRDPRLDVPARAGLDRRRGERADPGLPDDSHRPTRPLIGRPVSGDTDP